VLHSPGGEGPKIPERAWAEGAAMTGTDVVTFRRERPGMSAFVLKDGAVYHTYSTYARGLDGLWGAANDFVIPRLPTHLHRSFRNDDDFRKRQREIAECTNNQNAT
jgi:Bacterial protein of unknown function (DUF899)